MNQTNEPVLTRTFVLNVWPDDIGLREAKHTQSTPQVSMVLDISRVSHHLWTTKYLQSVESMETYSNENIFDGKSLNNSNSP